MLPASDRAAAEAPGLPTAGRPDGPAFWVVLALAALGLAMTVNQTFVLGIFGFQPMGNGFLYYLIGIFLAVAFLCFPRRARGAGRVRWYDWVLAAAASAPTVYLAQHALRIINEGWEFSTPPEAMVAASTVVVLALEGVRRCGGLPLLIVAI